jgi:glycosyltransferase involved in cell wall biosynthesis
VEFENRDPIVLFVGRRTSSKRLDVLYEAMRIVWEDHPEVVLQVAGSPPGMGRDPAVWMAADPRVEIVTAPSEQEKDDLLGKARVVVSPSLSESFGITTLEAWAQGTPVVLVDSPVNRSVVRQDLDGRVAEGAEAADLAKAVAEVVKDPLLAAHMGRAGRERVEAEFSWANSSAQLDDLIRAVVASA